MGNNNNNAVLIFTFSPVQGFIEASRRTRDFFTGSYILSWLTFRVMWRLSKEKGIDMGDFVYPIPENQPLWKLFDDEEVKDIELLAVANFPNRFVLRVKYETGKELVHEVKRIFYEEWKALYSYVYKKILEIAKKNKLLFDEIHEDAIEEQFDTHVENYFTPFAVVVKDVNPEEYKRLFESENSEKDLEELIRDQGRESYGYTYDLAERILGSRKTLRPYKGIVDYPEGADLREFESCSVCGERKALAIKWEDLKNDFDIQDDRLCGVCLVKRLGYKYFEKEFEPYIDEVTWQHLFSRPNIFQNFPSTREIAGIKFKEKLLKNMKAAKSYDNYITKMPEEVKENNKTSSVAYLRRRMREKPLSNIVKYDSLLFHKDEHNNILKEFKELSEQIPPLPQDKSDESFPVHQNSYFAIFYADGDHMGKWLGLKQEIRKGPLTEEFHKDFSKAISEYALEDVPQVVEKEHPGKLVYAGGDDVFAFVHPWDIMSILDKLRRKFESRLNKFPTVEGKKPSMSAGVVVGHAKAPLKRLIRNVRDAEKKSKDIFCRNAFVIRVVVRSGSTWNFGGKWKYEGNEKIFDTAKMFTRTMNLLMDEGEYVRESVCNLSSNFIYDIRDMLMTFDSNEFDEDALSIFKSLFKRSFMRKIRCNSVGDSKEYVKELFDDYMNFLDAMIDTHLRELRECKNEDKKEPDILEINKRRFEIVENFANMFYVARFLVKEAGL